MATLLCRRLTFGYDGSENNIFDALDLVIDTGWRAALVGRNGRGKTTLLRLIHGTLAPDAGAIEAQLSTYYFPPTPTDPSTPARWVVKDAIAPFRAWEKDMELLLDAGDPRSLERYGAVLERYQESGGYQIDANIARELAELSLDERLWDKPFAELSGGEQTRFLLAGLFASDGGYPLIDEPTNHLDRAGRRAIAAYLRKKPGFLLVSHDRAFLDDCVDHVIALNAETIEVQRTTFSAWRDRFLQRLHTQRKNNVLLRRQISSLEETAQQRRAGAAKREATKTTHVDKGFIGARARRQMKRALAAEQRADAAVIERKATLIDVEKRPELKLNAVGPRSTSMVTANNLTIFRDHALFEPISFQVEPGDRLAIVGNNGSGKTSLLDLIEGIDYSFAGTLVRPSHVTTSRAHQHPAWTRGLLSHRLRDAGLDETRFRQIMAALGVRGAQLEQPIERFSQGQLKKVDLARSFIAPAHLLLWDEPLNYVDIDAREQIEAVLLRDQPTVVFIEHDARFVENVATKIGANGSADLMSSRD